MTILDSCILKDNKWHPKVNQMPQTALCYHQCIDNCKYQLQNIYIHIGMQMTPNAHLLCSVHARLGEDKEGIINLICPCAKDQ